MLDVTEKINADMSVTALPFSYADRMRGEYEKSIIYRAETTQAELIFNFTT